MKIETSFSSDLSPERGGRCLTPGCFAGGVATCVVLLACLASGCGTEPTTQLDPPVRRDPGRDSSEPADPTPVAAEDSSTTRATALEELRLERTRLDRDVWSDEVDAQEFEQYFVRLWDQMRASADPAAVLAKASFRQLTFAALGEPERLELDVLRLRGTGVESAIEGTRWSGLVRDFTQRGYRIVESEWHHSAFSRTAVATQSQVSFVLHVVRNLTSDPSEASPQQRLVVRGVLHVTWLDAETVATPELVEIQDLEVLVRTGVPGFRRVLTYTRKPDEFASAHPIIVFDLDGNSFPEILISRWNRVYWNEGGGRFREAAPV